MTLGTKMMVAHGNVQPLRETPKIIMVAHGNVDPVTETL